MDNLENFKVIHNTMIWRKAALNQIKAFETLGLEIKTIPEVIGSHMSKSIRLPVVSYATSSGVVFILRDNFHDLNVHMESPKPITLSYEKLLGEICPPLNWDWYLNEIRRAREYSWREFSDEEMDNPDILSVTKNGREWVKEREEKNRWIKRMTSPEWYEKDWSSGTVTWDGEFGLEAKIFVQDRAFAEGMNLPKNTPYKPGCSSFIICIGGNDPFNDAKLLMERIIDFVSETK